MKKSVIFFLIHHHRIAVLSLGVAVVLKMEEENFSLDFSSLLTVEEEKESAGSSPQTNKDAGKLETNKEDVGKLEYGCEHYRRRCKIRAPCCDEIFACRHCHNDAVSLQKNPKDHHELVRRDVKQVICSLCNTEQPVAQICSNCGVKMGEYFCNICKFYDDDTRKGQFHCDDCGICRVGGRDEFFHCKKCGSCYTVTVLNKHVCVEQSMKNNCPICYEYLFDSIKGSIVMNCGHTMHSDCLDEMAKQNLYRCPICSKTVLNMSDYWQRLDMEKFLCANPKAQTCSKNLEQHNNLLHCCPQVTGLDLDLLPNELKWLDLEKPHHFSFLEFKQIEANKLHEEYQFDVSILCNDCNGTSKAPFHIFGHKCRRCNSYNTRRIATPCDEGNAN